MNNLAIIAATSENMVIGRNNQLPWHLPADLQHFKKLTLHKPIIMGFNTWLSLGKALPNRLNIVLSKQNIELKDAKICGNLETAIICAQDWLKTQNMPAMPVNTEIMFIGGAQIYQQALPLVQKIYLTKILISVEGDAFFPDFNHLDFELIKSSEFAANANYPAYIFNEYCR